MDTRQLRTLIAVADRGSFARAAEAVHITPSAVSQQIMALEAELGRPIFDRGARSPSLNPQGLKLLDMAREVVRLVEETRDTFEGRRKAGVLNIGAVRTSSLGLLPPVIVSLRKDYPDLKINLRVSLSNSLIVDVLADRLDMAVVAEHVGMPKMLRWSPFIQEPLVVIAPPDTPGQTARQILQTVPYVRFSNNMPLARLVDAELAKMNVMTQDIAEIDSISTIVECVAAGLGAGIVPDMALRNTPTPLKIIPFGAPQIYRQIGIVQGVNSPKAAFAAELHHRLAKMAGAYGVHPS